MNRRAYHRLAWLGGLLLALAAGGCATYQPFGYGDGYYGSPGRYDSPTHAGYAYGYGGSNYGRYYYSTTPIISIGYGLLFGYPYYSYTGCSYGWSAYCRWYAPGYGYGYGYSHGYGYGFGMGYRDGYHHGYGYGYGHGYANGWRKPPRHDYQPPRASQPKPQAPVHNNPPAPQASWKQNRPIRTPHERTAQPEPRDTAELVTPPVSTGSAIPPDLTPPSDNLPVPRNAYWRIPQNRRIGQPDIPPQRPIQPVLVRSDDDSAPVRRNPAQAEPPVRRQATPAADDPPDPAPRAVPPPAREPKPVRDKPRRSAAVAEDVEP